MEWPFFLAESTIGVSLAEFRGVCAQRPVGKIKDAEKRQD